MPDSRVVNLRDFPGKGMQRVLPPDIVRVDRGSPWGNQFKIGDPDPNGYALDRTQVVMLFRRYLDARAAIEPQWLEPLRDKQLACWCTPLECHAEVILEWLDAHPRAV